MALLWVDKHNSVSALTAHALAAPSVQKGRRPASGEGDGADPGATGNLSAQLAAGAEAAARRSRRVMRCAPLDDRLTSAAPPALELSVHPPRR